MRLLKLSFIVLCQLLLATNTFAQDDYTVKWSKTTERKFGSNDYMRISPDGEGGVFIVLKNQGTSTKNFKEGTFILEHYNANAQRVKVITLPFEEDKARVGQQEVILVGDKLWLLNYILIEESSEVKLLAKRLDRKTLQPISESIEIASDHDETYKVKEVKNDIFYHPNSSSIFYGLKNRLTLTENRQKLLVTRTEEGARWVDTYDSGMNKSNSIRLHDVIEYEYLSLKAKKEGATKREIGISAEYLDEKQLLYIKHDIKIKYINKGQDEIREKKYSLLSIDEKGKLEEHSLNFKKADQKYLLYSELAIDGNGYAILTGYFSEDEPYSDNFRGLYFIRINLANYEVEQETYHYFPIELLADIHVDYDLKTLSKLASKGRRAHVNVSYSETETLQNGVISFSGEGFKRHYPSTTYSGNSSTTTRPVYYYGNIYNIRLSRDGNAMKSHIIGKFQKTLMPDPASFVSINENGKFYAIFNDHKSNLDKTAKDDDYANSFKKKSKSIVVIATLNEDGSISRKQLTSMKDEDTILYPDESQMLSDNSYLLLTKYKKTYRIGIITFQ